MTEIQRPFGRFASYLASSAACFGTAAVMVALSGAFDLANIVMVFLLTVFLVARWLGRGPAVMAAVLSVALFDVFFVPPKFSFAVADVQYLVTFGVMLAIGLVTTELTADLREQAEIAKEKESKTLGLYQLARDLVPIVGLEQTAEPLHRYVTALGHGAEMHLLDAQGQLSTLAGDPMLHSVAMTACLKEDVVELPLDDGRPGCRRFIPLRGTTRTHGVLIVTSNDLHALSEDESVLGTAASLAALTIERLHYVEVAQTAGVEITSERLRNSVLSALSHDLRTPLTALVGMADSLAVKHHGKTDQDGNLAAAIRDQANLLSRLVGNLLDMARLHAGKVELRRDWQLFEDVISSSLHLLRPALTERPVRVTLAPDMPLVEFDAVLLERVVCNLLENAVKYSPVGSAIEVEAFVAGEHAGIRVCDHGQGFPIGQIDRLFGMFERGETESAKAGVGLGLAISRAIMEAHGGSITAENREGDGACVTLLLPLGTPPAIEMEPADDQVERG